MKTSEGLIILSYDDKSILLILTDIYLSRNIFHLKILNFTTLYLSQYHLLSTGKYRQSVICLDKESVI